VGPERSVWVPAALRSLMVSTAARVPLAKVLITFTV